MKKYLLVTLVIMLSGCAAYRITNKVDQLDPVDDKFTGTSDDDLLKTYINPNPAERCQWITFTAVCDLNDRGTVVWYFYYNNRTETSTAKVAKYRYPITGSFPVKVICTLEDGRTISRDLTVTVNSDSSDSTQDGMYLSSPYCGYN